MDGNLNREEMTKDLESMKEVGIGVPRGPVDFMSEEWQDMYVHAVREAEVITANNNQAWQEFPWSMKSQSDWALAHGVNRFVYQTFAHKPLGEEHRPGMTMGQYFTEPLPSGLLGPVSINTVMTE